jgi:hypothetical protein
MKTLEKLFTLVGRGTNSAQIAANRVYRKALAGLLTGFLMYFGLLQAGCTFGLQWLIVGTMVTAAIVVTTIYWQPTLAGLATVIELLNKNDDPNKQSVLRAYLMIMICIAGTGSIAFILQIIGSAGAFIPVVFLLSAGTIACLLYSGTTDITKIMQWLAGAAALLVVVMIIISNPYVLGWTKQLSHMQQPGAWGFWAIAGLVLVHMLGLWVIWLFARNKTDDTKSTTSTSSFSWGKLLLAVGLIYGAYYAWNHPNVQKVATWIEQNTPDPKAPRAGLPARMDLMQEGEAGKWFVSFQRILEPLPSKSGMWTPRGGLALSEKSFIIDGGDSESVNIGISLEGMMEPDMYLKTGPSGKCRVINAQLARLSCDGDWILGNGQVYGKFGMQVEANGAHVTLYKFSTYSNAFQEVARFAIIRRNSDKAND